MKTLAARAQRDPILGLALLFFALSTWVSGARWANFEYRTFDLAYYVQAAWQLLHGRFQVSVVGGPLFGNHVEPIILLIAPLFLLIRHPLVFVAVQNAALASMGPVAFSIGQRLGLDRKAALLLASGVLITPAAAYIAFHEFHPEALTAPFILLLLRARLRGSIRAYWGWLLAILACKENMALLVITYCAVHIVVERERPAVELRAWYVWPMALSIVWLFACAKLITPTLNSGNIDYLSLYDRLGSSIGDILLKTITEPKLILGALFQSLSYGNLIWALLFPFLALPLLRPRWLLITTPILLQHLLSWRSSEWTIYFHYAAPILPLFWFASAETVVSIGRWHSIPTALQRSLPALVIVACIAAQIVLGPAGAVVASVAGWSSGKENRAQKQLFVNQVTPDASVLAPLPYLSHLAMREKLYSLHYVIKGLKTLSHSTYEIPPPTDFVLIDYNDPVTFDPIAGYYHPMMKTIDGRVIPSSDQLLHEFLQRISWTVASSNEFTTFRQDRAQLEPALLPPGAEAVAVMGSTTLISITKSGDELNERGIEITTRWDFQSPRDVFPWMFLKLISADHRREFTISRGLCGPEASIGPRLDRWRITPTSRIPDGDYSVEAVFVDNAKRIWAAKTGEPGLLGPLLAPAIPLGQIHLARGDSKTFRK